MLILLLLCQVQRAVPSNGRPSASCPHPAQWSAAASDIGVSAPPGQIAISIDGRELTIRWHQTGGRTYERRLDAAPTCSQRAKQVALVLAAWSAQTRDVDPVWAPAQRADTRSPSLVRVAPAAAGAAEAGGQPVAASPRNPTVIGGGPFTGVDGLGTFFGLQLEAGRQSLDAILSLRWRLGAFAPRALDLGAGTARWVGAYLGLDLVAQVWARGPWSMTAQAGPTARVLFERGRGFDENRSDVAAAPGAALAVRLSHGRNFWVETRSVGWPLQQSLRVVSEPSGAETRTALPSFEALLTVGTTVAAF